MTESLYGGMEAHTYYLVVGCVLRVSPKSGSQTIFVVVVHILLQFWI